MPTPKHIIKRIRGIPKQEIHQSPEEIARIKFLVTIGRGIQWIEQKEFIRDRAFLKAQAARENQIEQDRQRKEAETERQQSIIDARLKNLKKARRVLKKKRGE
jgi:hypothetical protein